MTCRFKWGWSSYLAFFLFTSVIALADTPVPTHTKAEQAVRVGSSPVMSSAGIYIAQERGYFAELGLAIEITTFKNSGAPLTAPLTSGDLDVGGGNFSSGLFNAIIQGSGIKIVADKGHLARGHDYLALLVRQDHKKSGRFKTLKDLKGFTFGLTALNGVSQEILTERFLRSAGLSLKDVKFLKLSYTEMNAAFAGKSLDATIQLEPFVTLAETMGLASHVGSAYDVYPDQPSAGILYSPAFMKQRPDDAVKFMAAYLKGVRDYVSAFARGTDRDKMVSILRKYIGGTDDALARAAPVGLNPNGYINTKALHDDILWYKNRGYISRAPDVDSIVDHRFVDAALRMIGRSAEE